MQAWHGGPEPQGNIWSKTGCSRHGELVAYAYDRGLIDGDPGQQQHRGNEHDGFIVQPLWFGRYPPPMLAEFQELPEGTVTILFTDTVASTALNQRLGDDAAHELRRAITGALIRKSMATATASATPGLVVLGLRDAPAAISAPSPPRASW